MFGIDTAIISALFGSLSGILGHWFKTKEEREKRKHEAEMMQLQMDRDRLNSELAIKEIEANLKVTEVQTEGQLLQQEAVGFNAAVTTLNKNVLSSEIVQALLDGGFFMRFFGVLLAFLLGLVDVVRGLVRPVLTAGAFASVGWLAYHFAMQIEWLGSEYLVTLIKIIIDAIIYVLTAATQFWFMDRAGARDFRKKH